MNGRPIFFQSMIFFLFACLVLASPLWAANCSRAEEVYAQALSQSSLSEKARLLEQTTNLCPSNAEAWNDLGYTREQQGRIVEANEHYKRAVRVNPSFTVAYAGLGDIQNIQKNYEQAAASYRNFIRQLDEDAKRGDPGGLTQYRFEYEQKLEVVSKKLRGDEIISADEITRALSGTFSKTRGYEGTRAIHPSYQNKAAIDVRILFDFGSSMINAASMAQVEALYQALRSPGLKGNRVKIIGHTDSVGSEQANLSLSRKRAESVKWALMHKGISASLLITEGKGESEPMESNETARGQAKNRRVTFLNVKK